MLLAMEASPKPRLFEDTDPEAVAVIVSGYRAMSPAKKLEQVCALIRASEQMAEARIRANKGEEIGERELRLRIASLRLDRQTLLDAFAWDVDEEGY